MASTAGPARASRRWPGRFLRRVFWPPNTSQEIRFLLASAPVQIAAPAILVILWLVVAGTGAGIKPGDVITEPALLVLVVMALIVAVALAVLPALTLAHRYLLRVMLGVDVPAPPRARRTTWRGLNAWLRAGTTWRQVVYHAFAGPVLAFAGLLMPFLWAAGVAFAAIFAYVGVATGAHIKFIEPGHTVVYGYLTVLGLVALVAAPRVGAAVVRLDVWAARALLGPSRVSALEHRVETSPRAGRAWWTPRTPSGGASSGTCTTALSSAWCPWRCTSAWRGPSSAICRTTPGR